MKMLRWLRGRLLPPKRDPQAVALARDIWRRQQRERERQARIAERLQALEKQYRVVGRLGDEAA